MSNDAKKAVDDVVNQFAMLSAAGMWGNTPWKEPEPYQHLSDLSKEERRKRTKEKKRIKKSKRSK